MRGPGEAGYGRRDGFALLGVLWALALLALLAVPAIRLSSESLLAARVEQARMLSRRQAEAAIEIVLNDLATPAGRARWPPDGADMPGPDATTIAIEREAGKIDLNAAPAHLLANLFEAASIASAEAEALAENIVAWRTPARSDGSLAEPPASGSAGSGDGVKHGAFETVDELEQVGGFTRPRIAALRRNLTVFSPRGAVDRASAPPLVRAALNGGLAPSPDPEGQDSLSSVAQSGVAGSLVGSVITVRATVSGRSRVPLTLEETVRLVDDPAQAYRILAWRDRIATPPAPLASAR